MPLLFVVRLCAFMCILRLGMVTGVVLNARGEEGRFNPRVATRASTSCQEQPTSAPLPLPLLCYLTSRHRYARSS